MRRQQAFALALVCLSPTLGHLGGKEVYGCARDQGLTLVQFSAQLKPFFLWDTLGGVGQQVTERLNLS